MLLRGVLLVAATAMLAGCVSDNVGTDFASVSQKIGPPGPGQSRIVVFQEKRQGLSMAICACEAAVDGASMGKVLAGKYAYVDRPAGHHELLISEMLFPGDTKREIVTESGRTYFYLVRSSKRHDALAGAGLVVGLAGIAVASVATAATTIQVPPTSPLDESAARVTLADLQPVN